MVFDQKYGNIVVQSVSHYHHKPISLKFTFTPNEVAIPRKQYFISKMLKWWPLKNLPNWTRHFSIGTGGHFLLTWSLLILIGLACKFWGMSSGYYVGGICSGIRWTFTKTIFGAKKFQWNGSMIIVETGTEHRKDSNFFAAHF